MRNKIIIKKPDIINNKIIYNYEVEGECAEAFAEDVFFIEYSFDLSKIPMGILMIPLLANILPISWVYDAEVRVPVCDKDFYESIEQFKTGYKEMYPMMVFGGSIFAESLQDNKATGTGSAAFFSGGADAFNTLVCHEKEKPLLITLWGADVKFEDTDGWNKVAKHLDATANDFELDHTVIKSAFRRFLKEGVLTKKVKDSGDGWWHGFQHGIGIISHAAPVAYAMGRDKVYIASSFTASEKGKVTCASDPSIDNNVRFCGARVIHDGYEFNRQMKLHNITQYSKKTGKRISLRVCWQSEGGSNCCGCEKCWRTIMGIYAEGFDPRDFGFEYSDYKLKQLAEKMRFDGDRLFGALRYLPIQAAMRERVKKNELPRSVRWFYDIDLNHIGEHNIINKVIRKVNRVINRLTKK